VHGTIYEFAKLPGLDRRDAHASPGVVARPRKKRAVPLVGIIRNPRSHRNKGHAAELADCSNILTETPATRAALAETLAEFHRRGIDYLVVDGGDGTVRDVLTCGAAIFCDNWPDLIVLPKGKTNALAIDLGLPSGWTLPEALEAAARGRSEMRAPIRVVHASGQGCVQGFFLGAGIFTLATRMGQEAHRWGAFNGLAVALTTLWTIMLSVFGRRGNPSRHLTPMRLREPHSGQPLPHSRHGRRGERFLFVATTFENFPLGIRPFGSNAGKGMKVLVLDTPLRWLLAMMPVLLTGITARFLERAGLHRFSANDVEADLGGSFILDGEEFPEGRYRIQNGPLLRFIVP
jgi:diacylglycerol kinase (ATP)